MKLSVVHHAVTEERVVRLMKLQDSTLTNPGVCISCGAYHNACESDAENYLCYSCGERQVYGAAIILLLGFYHRSTSPDTEV